MDKTTAKTAGSKVRIPLGLVLIVPFVIEILIVTGFVGYLSFRNGQKSVYELTDHWRKEMTSRIEDHIRFLMDTSQQINQINIDNIRDGLVDINDVEQTQHYFFKQVQIFNNVSSFYFSDAHGGIVGSGREGPGGSYYVYASDSHSPNPGYFRKYAVDADGNQTKLLTEFSNFDARKRPWYFKALEKRAPVWSDVYILFTGQDMAIAASQPVFDKNERFMGVVSQDIFLSQLGDFMKHLENSVNGQIYIIERSGLMVASSTDEDVLIQTGENERMHRISAANVKTPIINKSARFLQKQFDGFQNIQAPQVLEFKMDGQLQFLQVSPLHVKRGPDWLIVLAAPESDFMSHIRFNNYITGLLIMASILIAILIGIITAHIVSRPVYRLNASTKALATGKWEETGPMAHWIKEINELNQSFQNMSQRLKQTLNSLNSEIGMHKLAREELEREREFTQKALREKEVLLRELYHRSKNNMFVISSMLSLHASKLRDNAQTRIFQEMENRIHVMALVHEKLYQSKDLSSIDLSEYIQELADLVLESYLSEFPKIEISLDLESVPVLIDTAVPCGLALHEILTNAILHGFPGGESGKINIRLQRLNEEKIRLEVSDNGIGLPNGFNPRECDSLGMQTIFGLVEQQLNGTVALKTEKGLIWQLELAADLYQRRV